MFVYLAFCPIAHILLRQWQNHYLIHPKYDTCFLILKKILCNLVLFHPACPDNYPKPYHGHPPDFFHIPYIFRLIYCCINSHNNHSFKIFHTIFTN